MGILLGIVFPSIIVTGWGPRRESAGKKFPPGGMDEELQVQCSLVFSFQLCIIPSDASLFIIPKYSEKSVVHNGFLLVVYVGRNEEEGGSAQPGKRRVVTGEGKVSRDREFRRSRKFGREVTRLAIDLREYPGCCAYPSSQTGDSVLFIWTLKERMPPFLLGYKKNT